MTTETVIPIAVLAAVIIGVIWFATRKRRSDDLRERFGPEYDEAVSEFGDRGQAESELEARRKRVEQFNIRPLALPDQQRFANAWREMQAGFVDEPSEAIVEADRLVTELMQTRGYPMGNFARRAADISVDHPELVRNYRAAHAIALDNERGAASTEELRQAMVHYKALSEELLEAPIASIPEGIPDQEEDHRARAS
jgi:hypothetical protein